MENKRREIKTRLLNKEAWTWKKQGQKTEGGTDYIKEIITVDCKKDMKHVHSAVKNAQFLVAFAKLRKPTISFVMSVCPSVRMEQVSSHRKDFHEI